MIKYNITIQVFVLNVLFLLFNFSRTVPEIEHLRKPVEIDYHILSHPQTSLIMVAGLYINLLQFAWEIYCVIKLHCSQWAGACIEFIGILDKLETLIRSLYIVRA